MVKAIFWDYQEDDRGAWVKCHIPEDRINENYLAEVMNGEIKIDDGRRISADQRRKIYSLVKNISNYTGHDVEDLKENILKINFMIDEDREYFSLSNVDMTTARYFIEYILNFIFEWDIPLDIKTQTTVVKEINNYLYLCLIHRKCAVCGNKGDIHHHTNLVGMGRNRHIGFDHTNSELICLCRIHHTECHTIGHSTFEEKYKIHGIKVNESTIKKLNL